MITVTTLQDAIFDWVNGAFTPAIPAIWQNQNAPRPTGAYFSLRIAPMSQVGQDFVSMASSSGVVNIKGNREFTLMVEYYGSAALEKMEHLRSSLEKPTVQQFLSSKDIAFVDRLMIQDTTALLDSRLEQRCVMDLLFRTGSQTTDTVSYIGTLKMEKNFSTDDTEDFVIVENVEI